MEIRIKIGLPEDPARRALVITIVASVLLHIALLGALVWTRPLGPAVIAKRGEPLLFDLAPEKPEEKAPRGDPSRPVAPEPPAARTPEPPRPRVAQPPPAPRVAPPAPRPAPEPPRAAPEPPRPAPEPPKEAVKPAPAPEPPKEVAAASPAPEPPRPTPEPPARAPEPGAPARSAAPAEASRPSPPSAPGPQTALAPSRPGGPPGMWRGGGLDRGRGGVEGDPVPLDTIDPRYADYFRQLRQLIQAKMAYPHDAGRRGLEADVFVEFHIAKNGQLELIQQRRLTGETVFAQASIIAVQLASPFPPVPDGVAKGTLAITGHFVWRIADDPIGLVKRFRN